jgi:penicillin-binding protein 1A
MVGGKDFQASQFNRAAQALRSPGSTFKLFVYLTALQEGMRPERIIVDSARCFGGYCPRNFGNRYFGAVTMVRALQNSLNTVAVQLLQQLGFDKVIATAKSLGINRPLGRYYPLALGAYEQTVLDMTAAYAAINNRGIYIKPTPFEEILGPEGQLLWSRRLNGDRGHPAVASDIADAMLWMLRQAVAAGTGAGASLDDRPVAGKTGTSEGGRDLWFIGSIPQLTTGVWLGYDNSRETGTTSVLATYAWRAFMAPIVKGMPVRQFPPKPELTGSFQRDAKPAAGRGPTDAGSRWWPSPEASPEPAAGPSSDNQPSSRGNGPAEQVPAANPNASPGPSANPAPAAAPSPPAAPAPPTAPPPMPLAAPSPP